MDALPDAAGLSQTGMEATSALSQPQTKAVVQVDELPKFDLDAYIANYTGRTRYDRLYLIGTCSPPLATDALKAAISEAKANKDIVRYEKAVCALAKVAPSEPEASLDSSWIQETQQLVKSQTEQLEHELQQYKNNLIKESIRMGTEDLANHYYNTGDLSTASTVYSRMREFCTTSKHIISMLFKMVNISIEQGDWLSVETNVQRLRESSPSRSRSDDIARETFKISAASALSQMHLGSFREAAATFLSISPTLGDNYEIITPNDVAVYGGLCALASMNREELQSEVLEKASFRSFLQLEPHIRHAIRFFCNCKFRACLDILEAYRSDYLLDIHLQRFIPKIYQLIRTKCMVQYLIPFSRATLDSMAKIFSPELIGDEAQPMGISSPFVQELITLIQDGVLDFRIDLEKGLLVSNQIDLRSEVQQKTLESLQEFNEETHWRLLRSVALQHGFHLQLEASANKGETVDPSAQPEVPRDNLAD